MSIITISRGSFSHGKEIAEKAAYRLGYECVGREVIIEASEEFNIPEIKLMHAIKDAPSFLDRFAYGREKYIAYVRAALLKHLVKDKAIYHGFAGHFFVGGISHLLKVRVIADLEDRVSLFSAREGLSREEALKQIEKLDEERMKWSKCLYGIDTWDPSLYDLVIHISKISVEEAVDIICHTVGFERFRTTPDSQQRLEDLLLAAEVKAALVGSRPNIEVSSECGKVRIKTQSLESQEMELTEKLTEIAKKLDGVKEVKVEISPIPSYLID